MEEHYLVGLFVLLVFGVIFSNVVSTNRDGTEARIKADFKKNPSHSVGRIASSNSSGVARYLRRQQGDFSQNTLTGVSRYLNSEKELEAENAIVTSGVAKYLVAKEQTSSGVSKYMVRQASRAKKEATQKQFRVHG